VILALLKTSEKQAKKAILLRHLLRHFVRHFRVFCEFFEGQFLKVAKNAQKWPNSVIFLTE